MLFDTHCHVFDEAFDEDRESVMERAKDMRLMIVGFNEKTNLLAKKYAYQYHAGYSVGIHPSDVKSTDISYFDVLKELAKDPLVKAIGECGLDYYWDKDNKDDQREYFVRQIELSIECDLPLIIHVRDALADAYEILSPYKGRIRGVMHCFTGSYEMAMRFIDLGLMIGLDGPITFKNAINPKDLAKRVPLDKILVETDCPYLTPNPFRGKRNEPSYVKYVVEEIAQQKNIDIYEVEKITYDNGMKLFGMEE